MRLGICLGTRYVGYAIANETELLDWGVVSAKGKWTNKKLRKILHRLESLIKRYSITEVIVKIPDNIPVSKGFIQLIGSVNILFESLEVQARYITLSDLKLHYCHSTKVNKARLFAALEKQYPELELVYPKHRLVDDAYYYKITEAVSAVFY